MLERRLMVFCLCILLIVGDLAFQAQRRAWSQAASRAGVTNFGYLFTQPQPAEAALGLGGKSRSLHTSLLFGIPALTTRILFTSVSWFRNPICVRRSFRHFCIGNVTERRHARLLDFVRHELEPQRWGWKQTYYF